MVECNGNTLCTDEEPRPVQRFHEAKSSETGSTQQNGGFENGKISRNGDSVMRKAPRPHPFIFRLYPTRWDRITWYVMAFTLAPIKLCLTVAFLALAWIPGRITVIGLPLQPDKPFSRWRMAFKSLTVFLARCAGFCLGVVSQKVKGKQASSKEAPIIVMGPHLSYLDPLGGALIGLPGAVSIIRNARLPIIGTIFRVNQSIFVERGDPESRSKATRQIRARAEAKGAWPQLIVFPDGVCSNGTCVLPYKLGAFLPGVSVQPMTLKYNNRLDITSWLDTGPGLLALISLALCTPVISIELEFHPVYHPSEEEKMNPSLFASNVRDVMAKHLGLPKTDIGYSDLRDLVKQTKPNTGVVHMWKNIITKGFVEMPGKEHFS